MRRLRAVRDKTRRRDETRQRAACASPEQCKARMITLEPEPLNKEYVQHNGASGVSQPHEKDVWLQWTKHASRSRHAERTVPAASVHRGRRCENAGQPSRKSRKRITQQRCIREGPNETPHKVNTRHETNHTPRKSTEATAGSTAPPTDSNQPSTDRCRRG